MPLSDYEAVKEIGSGGFGVASLVKLKSDKSQQFVLKVMEFSSPDEYHDCVSEVEMLRQLGHPRIVQFIESFSDTNTICIVMEFCAGGDLAKMIVKQSRNCYFSEVRIISWTLQVLDALQYLHRREKPVLHRDMKPANIFLTGDLSVKIGDFGISRELAHFKDLATTVCGTPLYLSPEVLRSEAYDHKCDIWSLGCCVYEMMTFRTAVNPLLLAVLNIVSVNPLPRNYSEGLIGLVRDMLQVDPKSRPSATEAMDKLQRMPTWDPNDSSLASCTDVTSASASDSAAATPSEDDDDDGDDDYGLDDLTLKGFEFIDPINFPQARLIHNDTSSYRDSNDTLKNTNVKNAAPVWTPEKVLKHYGYCFSIDGHLVNIKTRDRFVYKFTGNPKVDEERYQVIAKAVTDHIHDLLEKTLKMQKIYIPLDYTDGEPWSFVYSTSDIFTNPDKLLILIGGSEPVRAGIWSRRAIINDSIDAGSQIPCIRQAMREGYAVLLLNQNQTYVEVDGVRCPVRESETALRHVLYVWDNIVTTNTRVKNVAFFTHTCGGTILAELAVKRSDSFRDLVFGMALCHFQDEDILKRAPKPISNFFSTVSKVWMASDKPIGESSKNSFFSLFDKDKDRILSAGDVRPEWTAYSCKDSAFKFLSELYTKRQQNSRT